MAKKKILLFFDDTGSRELSDSSEKRNDGMDQFALGGILVRDEDVPDIVRAHRTFCQKWQIDYPLHSSSIRCRRGKFGWLNPEKAGYFMPELRDFLLKLPVVVVGAVINRPGYFDRYRHAHKTDLWDMDKTAFCILIERATKYADLQGRQLEVFFEQSGKREDRAIIRYMKELKQSGSPFNATNSKQYNPLKASDYKRVVLGEPRHRAKATITIQIADMMLYPIAKAAYESDYRPYLEMKEAGLLIDDQVPEKFKDECGIKYSCFDR